MDAPPQADIAKYLAVALTRCVSGTRCASPDARPGCGTEDTICLGKDRTLDREPHIGDLRSPTAIREPARIALGMLHTQLGVAARHWPLGILQRYEPFELDVLAKMVSE